MGEQPWAEYPCAIDARDKLPGINGKSIWKPARQRIPGYWLHILDDIETRISVKMWMLRHLQVSWQMENHEESDTGYLPSLKKKVKNIKNYDIVFLGYPIWAKDTPQVIESFIKCNTWDVGFLLKTMTCCGTGRKEFNMQFICFVWNAVMPGATDRFVMVAGMFI